MKNTKFLFPEGESPKGMVSVSQLMTHMSCPKKWEYNYVHNLAPRVERPFLTVGKLCHKGMQVAMVDMWKDQQVDLDTSFNGGLFNAWMNHGIESMQNEWVSYIRDNSFLAEEMPEQGQIIEDAVSVFSQAFMEFEPWKYKVLTVQRNGEPAPALELHFKIPCAGSKGLHGYIDAILQDKTTGFVWCTDYKFRKSMSDDAEEAFNVQNAVYTRACEKMGIEITGTMTWQHCNTPAADPTVNKNGTISRAKIKTTWEHYANFCSNHGQDPKDYREEMEPKLADIEWFRATYEYRNDPTVKRIWDEVVVPASWAVKRSWAGGNKRFMYPWNCKMCQYQSLCQAELRGYDVMGVVKLDYVVGSGRAGRGDHDNKGVDNNTPSVV